MVHRIANDEIACVGKPGSGCAAGIEIEVIAVQGAEDTCHTKTVAALQPGIGRRMQRIRTDKIHTIAQLLGSALKDGAAPTGIEQEARHILRMVLDDQLRGVAIGDLDTIGSDGLDALCGCLGAQLDTKAEKEQNGNCSHKMI